MPFCTQCGHNNPDAARFCAQCGARLAAAGAAEPAIVPPPSVADSSATITFGTSGPPADAGEVAEPVDSTGSHNALDPDEAAAVDALPHGSALLVVQRGPGAGNRFLLDREVVTAGRHPDSEIFLDDITVSRRHVEFRRTPEGYTVRDVGSLNGTYVNRDRIDESPLHNGDEVQVGKFRLVFFAGAAAQGA